MLASDWPEFSPLMIQRKKVEFDRYPVVPNEMHLHFQPFRETEAGRGGEDPILVQFWKK